MTSGITRKWVAARLGAEGGKARTALKMPSPEPTALSATAPASQQHSESRREQPMLCSQC